MEKCKMIKELPMLYSKWNKYLSVGKIYNCEIYNDEKISIFGKTIDGGEFKLWILNDIFYDCFINPINEKYKCVWQ